MPGVVPYQANAASAGTGGFPGSVNLSCAYTNPNIAGNIGIAWVTTDDSSAPAGLTDTNGNLWYPYPGFNTNLGTQSLFVCPVLKAGANTVTTSPLTISITGGPNLVVIELTPPPCPPGAVSFHAFNPPAGPDTGVGEGEVLLNYSSSFAVSRGAYYHTLIAFLYDGHSSGETTLRTWTIGADLIDFPPPHDIAGGLIQQFAEPAGYHSGAVGYSTVPYPYVRNSVTFQPSPSTPPVPMFATSITALLITTPS